MKATKGGVKVLMVVLATVFLAVLLIGMHKTSTCQAGEGTGLIPEKWWPSKWGPDDERGANNYITPSVVMSALKIPKTGQIYRLTLPYTNHMPLPWGRTYSLTIPGIPTGGPYGKQGIVWNDEFLVGEIAQVGTQFDGMGHIGLRDKEGVYRWYNGRDFNRHSAENAHGLKHNGPEFLVPYVCRGILIDAAGLKGVKTMKEGEIVTVEDIEACIKKAGIGPIKKGDAVLVNTGWIELWEGDPKVYNHGCPGVGIKGLKYLVEKEVSIVGADTWPALDAAPGEDPDYPFPAHSFLECVSGIGQLQNLDLRELAKDKVYEFLFVFAPVPLAGATGSPVSAFAVK
jgi:kynurenine formamidase